MLFSGIGGGAVLANLLACSKQGIPFTHAAQKKLIVAGISLQMPMPAANSTQQNNGGLKHRQWFVAPI